MDNIIFQPHILIDNDTQLFQDFINAIEKSIEQNRYLLMPPPLNYINDKKRKISLKKLTHTKGPILTHFCSEGISNYYHYKSSNDIIYVVKECISYNDLHDRLCCFIEI